MELAFEVTIIPTLTEQESNPYAVSYLTTDVKTEPILQQTEKFGARLWQVQEAHQQSKNRIQFVHRFRVSKANIFADTAYCIQCYCQMFNHKSELCGHRCGCATFALRGMANALDEDPNVVFWCSLRDHGHPPYDRRGKAMVHIIDVDSFCNFVRANAIDDQDQALLVGGPNDPKPTTAMKISSEYFHAIDTDIFNQMRMIDQSIRVPKLPIYVLSNGVVMPSCAFIMFMSRPPPFAPEEYHINTLAIALRRNLPTIDDTTRDALFCDANVPADDAGDHTQIGWNRKASILMEAATLLSVSFPYLYDYGISENGTSLVAADEFVRTGRISMALDCEDGSVETLIFLWYILQLAAASSFRCLAMAYQIRLQYVVTVCLKSVTRSSHSNGLVGGHGRRLAAHACCDMVPLRALARMLKDESPAINALIAERGDALLNVPNLRVVVGETTGNARSYVSPCLDAKQYDVAYSHTRSMIHQVFASARIVSVEDLSVESGFYYYAVSALVHDTLISPAAKRAARVAGAKWMVPQLVYVLGDRCGVPHATYVRCSPEMNAIAVRPLSLETARVVRRLAKFEHPIPQLAQPPSVRSFSNYAMLATSSLLASGIDTRDAAKGASSWITVCIPLHTIRSRETLDYLAKIITSDPLLVYCRVTIDVVTEYVATLTLHLAFSRIE
jgi:hypothetical protein